ncbi:MAG: GAF domain-containing protein [Elusimicrobia bacterium]|nr:GAF domain-containing protein [Elusimicrobiota bacterium]
MAEVVLLRSGKELQRLRLGAGPLTVGRSGENDLSVDDPRVSRRHGRFVPEGAGWAYEDLGSTHGSFVDGSRVGRVALSHGHRIGMGEHEVCLVTQDGAAPPGPSTDTPLTTVGPAAHWQDFATVLSRPGPSGDEGARRLKALFEITQEMEGGRDFSDVLRHIMDRAIAIMGAERGFIMLRDSERAELKVHVAREAGGDVRGIDQESVSRSLMRRVAETGEAVLVGNPQKFEGGATESMIANKIHTALCVPLRSRGRVGGVLYVDHRSRKDGFMEQDLAFLATFAVQAQAAIDWSRSYWELVEGLFAASDDIIMVCSPDGMVTQANQGAQRLLGRASLTGASMRSFAASGADVVDALFSEALANGVAAAREVSFSAADGRPIHASLSAFSMRDRDGRPVGICAIGRDLGDIHSLVEILSEANAKLREQEEKRSQFVGMITHEIKSPLSVVIGFAEMILQPATGSKFDIPACASKILAAAQRMLAMCQELLELIRVEGGGGMSVEDLDPAALLREVGDYAAVRAQQKGVSVMLDIDGAPGVIQADRSMLWRVFDNFVGNGVKYNREGGRLWIRGRAEDGMAVFEFQDEGIGMSAEDRARLFQQFFRAQNARKIAGTGLGLSIVKSIIDRHGGSVEVESELGKGSLFRVRWPLRQRGGMRRSAASVALAVCLAASPAAAVPRDPWVFFSPDSQAHVHASLLGTFATAEFLRWRGYGPWRATLLSGFLWGAAGALKEFGLDRRPSQADLKSDLVGIGLGMSVQVCYRF